jgi:hypothetical protein
MDTFLHLNASLSVLGWLECDDFQVRYSEIIHDAESPTPSSYTLPSVLYLLKEINPETSTIKNFANHRKTAVSFRDSHLFSLLKISFDKFKSTANSPVSETCVEVINLAIGFDFLGYQSDSDNHGMSSATQVLKINSDPFELERFCIRRRSNQDIYSSFRIQHKSYLAFGNNWIINGLSTEFVFRK